MIFESLAEFTGTITEMGGAILKIIESENTDTKGMFFPIEFEYLRQCLDEIGLEPYDCYQLVLEIDDEECSFRIVGAYSDLLKGAE